MVNSYGYHSFLRILQAWKKNVIQAYNIMHSASNTKYMPEKTKGMID